MKIGFLSASTHILNYYWKALKDKSDCWWGVTTITAYEFLKAQGTKNVLLKSEVVYKYSPDIINKLINQYLCRVRSKIINQLVDKISPDIWVFDTFGKYKSVPKRVPWVQAFHSMCFKEYFFHPMLSNYDLLLLPGEYHKREIQKRVSIGKDTRLRVVGYPKTDAFFNNSFNREELMRTFGLNPKAKTVMYAPTTWGVYGHQGLFPRWFDCEQDVFESLCSEIRRMGLNFIVKPQSNDIRIIKNKKLFDIASRYGVLWITKNADYSMTDASPYLWITDLLISDMSGIITDFMVLNRPVIFIEPDERLNAWKDCDMPPHFRKGYVVKEVNEILRRIEDSLNDPDKFRHERDEFLAMMFYKLDGKASMRAAEAILEFAEERGIGER